MLTAGLRTNVKRACSQLIRIGGGGGGTADGDETAMERWAVDSLNVSVATGILLHQLIASARSRHLGAADAANNGADAAPNSLPTDGL